jgi:hypothetical protein
MRARRKTRVLCGAAPAPSIGMHLHDLQDQWAQCRDGCRDDDHIILDCKPDYKTGDSVGEVIPSGEYFELDCLDDAGNHGKSGQTHEYGQGDFGFELHLKVFEHDPRQKGQDEVVQGVPSCFLSVF